MKIIQPVYSDILMRNNSTESVSVLRSLLFTMDKEIKAHCSLEQVQGLIDSLSNIEEAQRTVSSLEAIVKKGGK